MCVIQIGSFFLNLLTKDLEMLCLADQSQEDPKVTFRYLSLSQ